MSPYCGLVEIRASDKDLPVRSLKSKNCNYIVLEFYMLGKMISASNFSGVRGSNSHLGSSILLPFFLLTFFSKLGFVNEKWDTLKKSYFSLVLSERKVYCVFAFFYVHGFFCVPAVYAASRKPKFYTAFALSSSSRHHFFDPFLRGFLAQFSMFYWPAMYCVGLLLYVMLYEKLSTSFDVRE